MNKKSFKIFVLISDTGNIDRHNPYKPKLCGILIHFKSVKRSQDKKKNFKKLRNGGLQKVVHETHDKMS